jgi:uncharacterized protein YbjT (DUF2867 family)
MKITVFGATGRVGGHVVGQALDAGHKVVAVVRDPARLPLLHPSLELVVVPGLTDPEPLIPTLDGSDAAISAAGPASRRDVTVASTTVRGILAALDRSGVSRFIAVSAMPVGAVPDGDSRTNRWLIYPLVRALLRGIYGDLAVMEDEIRRSGLQWTVVRPPRLVDRPAIGRYRAVVGGNVPGARTMRHADLARAMLAFLDQPATVQQVVGVAR